MTDPTPSFTDLGINPEAAQRLLPHIDSFTKWELLRFLHDNPHVAASVEDLARYMGRDEMEVKPAARALATAGLAHQIEEDDGYLFSLSQDEKTRELISELLQGFVVDRLVRLAISSHILGAQRRAGAYQVAAR